MTVLPFALYDAFTSSPLAGSQAAIVRDARGIGDELRRKIACEFGAPATCFVESCADGIVTAQFRSTVAELPMCGHGTLCLMTSLVESGELRLAEDRILSVILRLPKGDAAVELTRTGEGRTEVMLDVRVPAFGPSNVDAERLAQLLGISPQDYHGDLPQQVATADFVHLIVPLGDLDAAGRLAPDFPALAQFCRANGLETVAAFTLETTRSGSQLHVRDFCPAVGVAESAAAGTTNAALAAYLVAHGIAKVDPEGNVVVEAEQGIELGRPSRIRSRVRICDGVIGRLQVGGLASKVLEGELHLSGVEEDSLVRQSRIA